MVLSSQCFIFPDITRSHYYRPYPTWCLPSLAALIFYIRQPDVSAPPLVLSLSHNFDLPTNEMNTKIIFTHPSSGRTVLVDEATGRKLYKIEDSRRLVSSVTKVFRYDNATSSVLNPTPHFRSDVNEPHEPHSPEGTGSIPGGSPEENGSEGVNEAVRTGEETSEDDSSLAENEIARFYWKVFASARMVFEGKVRRRADYMPFGDKMKLCFVFNHKGVSYRWSLGASKRNPKLFINDSSKTLIASFHPSKLFKKEQPYMEVTPAGMDMLDHIVVTYIPVEVRRKQM